jgi:DNA repair protein RecO (recombination protein O)
VLARGAKKSARRFGAALDLFVQGSAELEVKDGRDLDTLNSFDLTKNRGGIGADLSRFAGAAAMAELILRFAQDDTDPDLFEITADALDRVATADGPLARDAAVAGSWRILAALGFEPSLDQCGECQRDIGDEETVLFSHASGGVLCDKCSSGRAGRRLPPAARVTIREWLIGEESNPLSEAEAKAHQRLLREFVHEHLSDGRAMKAFDAWAA